MRTDQGWDAELAPRAARTESRRARGRRQVCAVETGAGCRAKGRNTIVTNRWLSENIRMGSLNEVSRKVSAWTRRPDPAVFHLMD